MLFKTKLSPTLHHGRLTTPSAPGERPLVEDRTGATYRPAEIDFVVPDDEVQAARVRTAGYATHSPMSMNLGPGATGAPIIPSSKTIFG